MTQPSLILHGGFHKTATSHIQSILARNRKYLERNGVRYIHHRHTRKLYTIPVQLNAYEKIGLGWKTKIYDDELAEIARRFFGEFLDSSARRVIISDENLAGHCGHCVRSGSLYRWRHKLLEGFAANIPVPVSEVHLSVRNYADFFAAAYVEYLRSVSAKNFADESHMRLKILEGMPNWSMVVELFAQTFSGARIYVWKYEDFRALEQRIIQNLCGSEIDIRDLKEIKDKNKRPTASGRAVQELIKLFHSHGVEYALEQRVEIQKRFPKGKEYGSYDPWTAQERAHLTRVYARDMNEIRDNPAITVIDP